MLKRDKYQRAKTAHSHTSQNACQTTTNAKSCRPPHPKQTCMCMKIAMCTAPYLHKLLLSQERRNAPTDDDTRIWIGYKFWLRSVVVEHSNESDVNGHHSFIFSYRILPSKFTIHIDDVSSGTRWCCAHTFNNFYYYFWFFCCCFFIFGNIRHIDARSASWKCGPKNVRDEKRIHIKIHLAHCWMSYYSVSPERNKPKQQIFSIDGKMKSHATVVLSRAHT